jgi:hypothetical protein
MNPQHFDIAHQKLTDYLLHFCVSRIYGGDNAAQESPRTFGGHAGFVALELSGEPGLKEGDLLLLTGHRQSKWRMAWLKRVRNTGVEQQYLIQATHGDGETTWIDNVQASYFHRPTLQAHPEWRWTNEQHMFADQWLEAVMDRRETTLITPMIPVFFGDSAVLKARGRFGLSDYKPSKTIPDFRQLSKDDLLRCYDELCQMFDTHQAVRVDKEVDLE